MEKNIKIDRDYVTYEDFGAVGDGKTEDFGAICKAHEYANEHGIPVRAANGAHYYIHDNRIDGVAKSIEIKTDVNWGTPGEHPEEYCGWLSALVRGEALPGA